MPPSTEGPDPLRRPIDLGHLRRQTMGDEDLAAELLDLFARQARRILDDLAATPGPTEAARKRRADLLHTLCGSARAVGAWDVATGAEMMERDERCAPGAAAHEGSARPLGDLGRSVASARAAIDRLGARDSVRDEPPA